MKIYLDVGGRGPGLVNHTEALIPAGDRGFLFGDGIFETALLRGGEVPLLPLHLQRMSASARALGIPFDLEKIRAAAQAVAGANADGGGEFALRITLSRGQAGVRGYQPPPDPVPTLMVVGTPYTRPSGPLSAVTASFRVNPGSPLTGHKTLSALEQVLAKMEAQRAGCDEVLLLNTAGRVAEGAAANLFIVRQGLWLTPPLTDGCLPGVMRQRVLTLSGGIEWPITVDDLFHCDGVYLTNAVNGCLPLAALDGRFLPWGAEPPFRDRLFEWRGR
jgi:branched-chain amino acid aminotransferase